MASDPKKVVMNEELLQKYPLERSLPTNAANAFEQLLHEANKEFVLLWTKEKDVKVDGVQFWKFKVRCPKRNFADAYCHIGLKYANSVLPEWQKYIKSKEKLKLKLNE